MEPVSWRKPFAGRADQLAVIRRLMEVLFSGTEREEEAAFIATELAGNAIRHTRSGLRGGWFGLEVAMTGVVAHIAVTDLGGGWYPVVRRPQSGQAQEEHGRGLVAVAGMAVAMGVHGSPAGGHTIWADLAIGQAARDEQPEPLAS